MRVGIDMKILLDCNVDKIRNYSKKYDFEFWQLRTPLTRNKISDIPYGLDNGCFNRFDEKTWLKLLEEAQNNPPIFACLPDIVGDARRTLELFKAFYHKVGGLPRALVIQDGIGDFEIPWFDLKCVFVGGSDKFKISQEAMNAAKCAKMLGKWVHVGRVNSVQRLMQWIHIADSIDGSGISRFDHMLEDVLSFIKGKHVLNNQGELGI